MNDNEKTWDAMDSSGELSEDELDNVSGGGNIIEIPDLKHPVVSGDHICDQFKCSYCGSRDVFMLMGSRVHKCTGG